MHGRVKVKTTAEIAEQKRIEKLKKADYFDTLKSAMFESKRNDILNETALEQTGAVVSVNVDFYTAWNYRRRILADLVTNQNKKISDLVKTELSLTVKGIQQNPKSYWVWNHRRWACSTFVSLGDDKEEIKVTKEKNVESPEEEKEEEAGKIQKEKALLFKTDWKKELQLCNEFLAMDDRNFHCWDYRRWVVSQSEVSGKQELDYTTKLINKNFSNYSAWHYRSSLLPQLYPNDSQNIGDGSSIREDILLNEFDLVQNACFTEPEDQSAWLYLRWLMGRAQLNLASRVIYSRKEDDRIEITVVLSHPVKIVGSGHITVHGEKYSVNWTSSSPNVLQTQLSITEELGENPFLIAFDFDSTVIAPVDAFVSLNDCMKLSVDMNNDFGVSASLPSSDELSILTKNNLEMQLENCHELLALEPESKWTMITIVYLMQTLKILNKEIIPILEKLQGVDTYRFNYYEDFKSTCVFEDSIVQQLKTIRTLDEIISLEKFELSLLPASLMSHLVGITHLSVSNNLLRDLNSIHLCKNLVYLNANNNKITGIPADIKFLASLETLLLENNVIENVKEVLKLGNLPSLKKLSLLNNPVTSSVDYKISMKSACSQLTSLDNESI